MRKISFALVGIALAARLTLPAAAQDAASLDELLDNVRSVRQADEALFDQRSAEYDAAPADQQARMLAAAQAARDALAETATMRSEQYSANEVTINDLNRQLVQKASSLGVAELFGLARQTAADVAQVLEQSLITTQLDTGDESKRDAFLRQFAASRETPSPAELERLWFETLREMTATGQVARYRAQVVRPSGSASEAEVVRIGPFSATSEGQFLAYLPTLRTLNVLPRQLPSEFMEIAAAFEPATEGYHQAVVDPERGVLTGLYVDRPTYAQRIELGEEIGYVIIAVGLAGAVAFLSQLITLIFVRISVGRQLKKLSHPTKDNPLGRVLLAFKGDPSRLEEDSDVAELRISEAVLREVPRLERFQPFLRLCVAAGPLLGLVGTVWGMILTFQSITETGSSDPRLMATGIGQAMIATVLGLGIAIPLLFANALLNSLSRSVVQILDEQSAGMLAESIERQRGV